MQERIICQGRRLSDADVSWLQGLVSEHRDWSRHGLAKEVCRAWKWRAANGQAKTFAARSLLIKLEQRGLITLPPLRTNLIRQSWTASTEIPHALPDPIPINSSLNKLRPLTVAAPLSGSFEDRCFKAYLARHHYLGFNRTVGENLKYLVRDQHGRDVACVLFGAAAWKTAARDEFIGWDRPARERNLQFITNNTRFLILPWVSVPHMASHILGLITRRLRADWQCKYDHSVHLVETFVEHNRFRGTCYRAANWVCVGRTKGRGRQDRDRTLRTPVKDIYLYPLIHNFREALCHVDA